jgi:hypothetical protein
MNLAFPIKIFETRTVLERFAQSYGYAPYFL